MDGSEMTKRRLIETAGAVQMRLHYDTVRLCSSVF